MKTMKYETLVTTSKVFGVGLVLLGAARFLAPPTILSQWSGAWMVITSVCIAGVGIPLALVHAGLAVWADEALERIHR